MDENGKSFKDELDGKKSKKLKPIWINTGEDELNDFILTEFDDEKYDSLKGYFTESIKPTISALDYKEQPIRIETGMARYWFDTDKETLIEEVGGKQKELGCGKIIIKSGHKKKNQKLPERIEITCELTPDYHNDYEVISYHRDEAVNQKAIEDFMAKYVTKPFEYQENIVGVEINFNKEFYKLEKLRLVSEILDDIQKVDRELRDLEEGLVL